MKFKAGGEEMTSVQSSFEAAVKLVQALPRKGTFQPSYIESGTIYSYFKQSKLGPCTQPKPGFWDVVGRAKWEVWSGLGDMSQDVAMKNYVEEIKKIFYRFQETSEYEERQEEFAHVLIPFCQASGLELSTRLKEIAKVKCMLKEEETVPKNEDKFPHINGDDITEVISSKENGVHTNDIRENKHSLLFERNIPEVSTKVVSFKVSSDYLSHIDDNGGDDDNKQENGEIASLLVDDSEEDEIYCDSLDPDQVVGLSNLANKYSDFDITNVAKDTFLSYTPGPQERNVQNTSMPYPIHNTMGSKTNSSSESYKSDFEIVDHDRHGNLKTKAQSVRKKDLNKYISSADSATKGRDFIDENKNKKHSKPKSYTQQASFHTHKGHASYCEGNNSMSEHSTQNMANKKSESHLHTSKVQSTHGHHHQNRHSSGSNDGSDDDTHSSSVSSASSVNVGLKIVEALERMEENLHHVLDRLDSIEGSIKELTKPVMPWWQTYVPSRVMIMWTAWPVLVNIMSYIYWKRKRNHHLRNYYC